MSGDMVAAAAFVDGRVREREFAATALAVRFDRSNWQSRAVHLAAKVGVERGDEHRCVLLGRLSIVHNILEGIENS